MHVALKVAVALPALLIGAAGIGWLADPATAAQNLGMPLLEGAGLSTQLGDFASFFIGLSAMIVLGLITQNKTFFHCAALLLFGSAVFRTVAWAAHGASFETGSIGVEVVVGALMIFAAASVSANAER